jgi:ATP phosphoribosyltransferase regulatory subunit
MELFDALQRKSIPEIRDLVNRLDIDEQQAAMLLALPELCGEDALDRAKALFSEANSDVQEALNELVQLADMVKKRMPELPLHFDLSELRGYHYHTGVVFAAFVPGLGQEVARGGRYDDIGAAFGRARPACGFSSDLKLLMRLNKSVEQSVNNGIFAPWSDDPSQHQAVEKLRKEGKMVVMGLPGQAGSAEEMGCSALLSLQGDEWVVTAV